VSKPQYFTFIFAVLFL